MSTRSSMLMAAAKSPENNCESQIVIDVLTAGDAGKFPHKNVAEASQRVSGVSISREFREGERSFSRPMLLI